MKFILGMLTLAFAIQAEAQITVSEYTKAMKVDAYNVPEPDVTFTSVCEGEIDIEIVERMASGGCLGNIIRSYIATDKCGNKATAEQYLSLQDKKGPEFIGVPADMTIDTEAELGKAPAVSALDLGDKPVEVTLSLTREDNKIIRTWTSTDKCGNESQAVQIITLRQVSAKG